MSNENKNFIFNLDLSSQIDLYNLPYGFWYKFRIAVYDEVGAQWSNFSSDSNAVDSTISKTINLHLFVIYLFFTHLMI